MAVTVGSKSATTSLDSSRRGSYDTWHPVDAHQYKPEKSFGPLASGIDAKETFPQVVDGQLRES
jgi:hypothetical protein